MSFGERLKRLRGERGWSQAQMAHSLGIHQKQISGYERAIHMPSAELLIRIAELFDVSLDYLALDRSEQGQRVDIGDRELLLKLEAIDKLPKEDKSVVKAVLDTFILKSRFQRLAAGQAPEALAS